MPCPAHPRPWWSGSLFVAGARRALDRNARRLWLARLDAARRRGLVTALHAEVGRALLRRLGIDGQLDPSHETIAGDAACSSRTVRRALARLAQLGLLAWQRRLVRAGWRAEQTSNAYQLAPDGPPLPAPIERPRCGGQDGRETRFLRKEEAPPPDRVAALKALERVALASRDRFARAWQARRSAMAV